MSTVTFDTLKFVEKLKAAGIPEGQAKAEAEALQEAFSDSAAYTFATKRDVADIRLEIRDVRAEIERSKYDLIKWMAGLLLAQAAVVAALVKLL
jgi:hypothetical protein